MKSKAKVRGIVTCGLFAALIFIATYMFHIPTVNGGYIHVGDAFIYLAASLMPTPFAAVCSALGGAMSDILSPGGAAWAIPTIIIKPVLTLFFTSKYNKIICKRNIAAVFLAGVIGVIGYGIAYDIMFGSLWGALLEMSVDVLQPIASGILFLVAGAAFDKSKIKNRFDFTFKK
jgi:uncharacterized repeat protein (TIGR04002 family)